MKSSYLISSSIFVLSLVAVNTQTAQASDAVFHCQSDSETPTTIVKASNGGEQSIFHWKIAPTSVSSTPEELCNSVTQKLNNYMSEGNDVSSLVFKASNIYSNDTAILPAVCVAGESEPCQLALFTLKPSDNPEIANIALDSILDPALQTKPVVSSDRGYQSTSYEVNFWDLLGF